jgi:hypothetical protein
MITNVHWTNGNTTHAQPLANILQQQQLNQEHTAAAPAEFISLLPNPEMIRAALEGTHVELDSWDAFFAYQEAVRQGTRDDDTGVEMHLEGIDVNDDQRALQEVEVGVEGELEVDVEGEMEVRVDMTDGEVVDSLVGDEVEGHMYGLEEFMLQGWEQI